MQADLPTTLESWTTVAANVVAIVGAISIVIVLQLNLRLTVAFQRRVAHAQELALVRAQADVTAPGAARDLLNVVLHWSENQRFSQGLPASDVTDEYREYVSRLVALFDLVLMEAVARENPETTARIAQELAKHSGALEFYWPLRFFGHLPVSSRMRAIIKGVLRS